MALTNPPPTVAQLASQLALCPVLITKGVGASKMFYPSADMQVEEQPLVVIAESSETRERYAEGAIGLISGSFLVVYYETGTDPGAMETLARQLQEELSGQYYGLCIRNIQVGLCSNPTPGGRATGQTAPSAEYRSISLTVHYGLTR